MTKSISIALALVLLLPAMIMAQGVTTGAFAGKVVDVDGNAVLGADITIVHGPTGTRYTTLSRSDGTYSVPAVRAGGPYTVSAAFEGFKTETKGDLVVTLGETKHVDFKMQLATVDAGEVIVSASTPIINPERTGAAQNVSQDLIENMPTITRNFADMARISPQINVADNLSNQAVSVGGRNNRYNNVQIDGAVNNDLFGLASSGTPGGQASTTPISMDVIQEFQVITAPYDVRHGGFTGGAINAITRTGTNYFEGSAYVFGRNEKFVGDGPSEYPYSEFSESTVGLRIGGPIKENKLFFFISGEMTKEKLPGAYELADEHKAAADRFISILRDQYGHDPGGYDSYTGETNSKKIFARIDWNINDRNRLSLRHNFVDANRDRLSRSQFTFALPDNANNFISKTNSTVLQLHSTLSNTMHNEFRINFTTIREHRETPAPFPQITVDIGSTDLRAGTERYSQANGLDQDIIELTDDLTIFSGKHTFIIGTHNEFFRFSNLFIRDNFGTYDFDSLDDLEAGTPNRYDYRYSVVPGNPAFRAEFSVAQLGFYAGDTWAVKNNFTLTFGLRVDVPFFSKTPTRNPDVEGYFPGKRTDHTPSGIISFSPRLGFNWDVKDDQDMQVRGGIGLFSGRTPYVWISNQFTSTGIEFHQMSTSSYYGPVPFSADPFNQPILSSVYRNEIDLIDENYKYPQVLRFNIGIDKQLPHGFMGTLEFVYTRNVNEIKYQNLNLVQTGTDPFDGRPLYNDRVANEYTDVVYLTNTNKGYQYMLSFQLQKKFRNGSWINTSYTYGEAKDINSGTSSQAYSNWKYNHISGDPNNPPLTYASQDVRHRISFAGSLVLNLCKNAPTRFSVFYNGRSGRPFNYRYYNDVNGDGGYYNDLIYVPNEGDVILYNSSWAELNAYINGDPALAAARGSIIERNAARSPWYHRLDLRLAQDIPIPGLKGHRIQLTLDIQNFLNMLNKDWGVSKYGYYRGIDIFRHRGFDDATGLPIIEFRRSDDEPKSQDIAELASRWQMQFGIRYSFGK